MNIEEVRLSLSELDAEVQNLICFLKEGSDGSGRELDQRSISAKMAAATKLQDLLAQTLSSIEGGSTPQERRYSFTEIQQTSAEALLKRLRSGIEYLKS